jgi:hypothetical protein
MSSFSLSGGVEVYGFISPTDTNDQYPVIDPLYGIDGLRNVNTLSDLDLIPTLRRRAGMVVGVSGGTSYYKLNLPPWTNTFSDWSTFNSGGSGTTISGEYLPLSGGTVSGSTNFTNGLTANTISATTYENLPLDVFVTGGTFSGGDIIFTNNSGVTFSVSGISSFDTFVTGFSYNNNTFTISQNSGSSLSATINSVTGLTSSGTIQSSVISASTYQNLPADIFITGGTFNSNTDTLTLGRSSGSSITITGFTDTFVTGATFSGTSLIISRNESQPNITATISTVSLSGALASVSFNIATTGSISASTFSGGTFIGNGSGLTGITDFYVTGGTFSGGTLTLNRQNGSLIVTGFTSTDTFTTAFTYSNNVFTINRNQSLPALTATINSVTGWTVNGNTNITGNLVVTGTSSLNGTISSSGLAGSTDRMVQVSSGGTISATAEIISGYITSGGTVALLLDNNSNWDINGNYSGTTITGTYQGQKHYNANYFYEAVADNLFIRLIRG